MNSNVTIKSIPNGLKVILNENCSFAELIEETGRKFRDSANFFKGGKLCVSFMGRTLSEIEENTLIDTMEKNGEFTVLYIVSSTEENTPGITRALSKELVNNEDVSGFGALYKGNVFKGEHLQFSCGVVICGDVEPGALIKAKGNVIVLGGLYGSVNIEYDNDNPGFVFALELSPERIKIGEYRYYSSEKPKWSIKPKYQGKIVYLSDGIVTAKDVSAQVMKELFKG